MDGQKAAVTRTNINTYDKLRKDLQHVKEWRKVALSVAIDGDNGGA